MTKKHFIAFAEEIKNCYEMNSARLGEIKARELALVECRLVCQIAKKFNGNFDENRFREACGIVA